MGTFLAIYQVSAETLFLNRLSEYLKEAILVSGFLGVLTTFLFSFIQDRFSFSKLAVLNLVAILCFTVGIFTAYKISDEQYLDTIIFIMFSMSTPIMAVMLLGFWGVFGRLFNLRQSKRIIGGIDTGQIIAAILASLSIPVLESYIPVTSDFLVICICSLLLATVILTVLTQKYDLSRAEISKLKEASRKDKSFLSLFRDNYVIFLSVFLIFSIAAFTFVQFSYQQVVAQQYPSENELRNFLAYFNMSILILGLLMQTFVNERIITQYGLRTSLYIMPTILVFFSLLTIVVGEYLQFDQSAFIYFFLFIALSRLFNFSLRESLENPTFKLFFMPLDNRLRFAVQTKVEGVVTELSRFIAGLLITGLSFLTFFELIHYTYALLFIFVGYFVIIGKLYNQYKRKIRLKLESQDMDENEEDKMGRFTAYLESQLSFQAVRRVIFSFKLLEKIIPDHATFLINRLMNSEQEEVRDYAQQKINEIKGLSVSENYVVTCSEDHASGSKKILSGADLDQLLQEGDISRKRISRLSRSENSIDRQYAAELLSNTEGEDKIAFLIELLYDPDPNVRLAALNTAYRKYNIEVINAVIDNLDTSTFSNGAANILTAMKEEALPVLDHAFYKTGQSPVVMSKIVKIMGKIGGEDAIQLLWNKIDYPDKTIASEVLVSLGECGFKANLSQVSRIKFAIESDIGNIAWNLGALGEIPDGSFGKEIKYALKEEISDEINHIYTLLSMLYDSQSIQLIKENVESKSAEDLSYAIELLDVLVSEDLKQRIIPVMDDISDSEKIKKLEIFYPREILDKKLVLKYLINRDFNQTNRWIKACAIYQIGLVKIEDFTTDLVACIFHPDPLIHEVACWSLYQIEPALYQEHSRRLGYESKSRLDEVVLPTALHKRVSRFEKVVFLKQQEFFKDIPTLNLTSIADIVKEIKLSEGRALTIDKSYNNNFYIVFSGAINLYVKGEVKSQIQPGEFIGELPYSSKYIRSNLLLAVEDSVLFQVNKDSFYDLLSGNIELAMKIVEYM